MNWAILVSALVQLLQNAPQFVDAVEQFWDAIHSGNVAAAPHNDEVRQAITTARQHHQSGGQAQAQGQAGQVDQQAGASQSGNATSGQRRP